MNEKRRGRLRDALKMLSGASSIIDSVCDSEQDSMDNLPENLQSSERFERMENAVDNMGDALEKIEEARECIAAAMA